ncbi:MAG: hypothetical protein IH612_15790 [Desulfofustis sp.]|nr:hypothetical protein [Desulfofustis sp.]
MALRIRHAKKQWERFLGITIILGAAFLYWDVSMAAETKLEEKDAKIAYATQKTDCKKRRDLPEEVRLLLPEKGLVFLSGGFVSVARRLRLDLSAGVINYGNSGKGESSVGILETEGTRKLTSKEMKPVVMLANVIWASEKKFTRFPPIADFDVWLVLCDGEEVKDIQSYGPTIDEVGQLYTLLWNLVSPIGK